jgi:hypothetical protein
MTIQTLTFNTKTGTVFVYDDKNKKHTLHGDNMGYFVYVNKKQKLVDRLTEADTEKVNDFLQKQ